MEDVTLRSTVPINDHIESVSILLKMDVRYITSTSELISIFEDRSLYVQWLELPLGQYLFE